TLLGPEPGPEAHAHQAPRHDEVVGPPVGAQLAPQLVHRHAAHQEVDVLRHAPEQLVADRPADLVDLGERQAEHAFDQAPLGPLRGRGLAPAHRRSVRQATEAACGPAARTAPLPPKVRLDGIHHVTAITADAAGNVDFYVRLLGLRLVKKTVNYDAP